MLQMASKIDYFSVLKASLGLPFPLSLSLTFLKLPEAEATKATAPNSNLASKEFWRYRESNPGPPGGSRTLYQLSCRALLEILNIFTDNILIEHSI